MGDRIMGRLGWRAGCAAAVLTAGMLASTGCRVFRDDAGFFVDPRDDYVEATVGDPLKVPAGMESSVGDTWPIPDIVEQLTAKTYADEVPRPRLLAGSSTDQIKIQKLGDKSWIVLADAPEQIWPLVRQLMEDSGVGVAREDPPAGILETDWFTVAPDASDLLRTAVGTGLSQQEQPVEGRWLDRVLLRIERGIRVGSSEVHVVHYRTKSERDGAIDTSTVPEVEGELITQIADYLAQGVALSPVSMVGREIASERKARIVEDESGAPTLVLHIGFDRAWATVDGALERAEVEVVEADRDNATFHAVLRAETRPGFFARIFSGRDSQGTPVTLLLQQRDDGVVVEVRDAGGRPVPRDVAEHVLLTLREYAA